MPDHEDHITAHAPSRPPFVAGCTCGWIGPRRNVVLTAVADEITHARAPHTDDCPICADRRRHP